ncbi:hypothetical protein H4S02_007443, partial [Coemansia sp. RSA 2611]
SSSSCRWPPRGLSGRGGRQLLRQRTTAWPQLTSLSDARPRTSLRAWQWPTSSLPRRLLWSNPS